MNERRLLEITKELNREFGRKHSWKLVLNQFRTWFRRTKRDLDREARVLRKAS